MCNEKDIMGDRANVAIVQHGVTGEAGAIFLYTHWEGTNLPFLVQAALARGKERWDQEAYLARIIFAEMIQDDLFDDAGFGIALSPPDNQHAIIVVDCAWRTVGFTFGKLDACHRLWGFDQYIRISEADLQRAFANPPSVEDP
jgi:hypothetical protein